MQRPISPLERSRQILRSIEFEEKSENKKAGNNSATSSPASQPEEGTSSERPSIKPLKQEPEVVNTETNQNINLDQQNIVNGIIFSEVLGKPVSKRRGRW